MNEAQLRRPSQEPKMGAYEKNRDHERKNMNLVTEVGTVRDQGKRRGDQMLKNRLRGKENKMNCFNEVKPFT